MSVMKLYQTTVVGGTKEEERVLRSETIPVEALDEACLRTIQDMRDTIKEYPFCVGLSAPQIGSSLSISIIDTNKLGKEGDLVMINPKILETKGKKDKKRESCMSVWGKQAEVERRDKVLVEYLDESFQKVQREFSGYESRCVQHEIDHLNGVLYIDRLKPDATLSEASFFNDYSVKEKE